jgi:uncharacterized cupredoxin-like copper-binding protein
MRVDDIARGNARRCIANYATSRNAAMSPRHRTKILLSTTLLGVASIPAHAQHTVKATLMSDAIQLDTRSVKAGAVTFDVSNAANNDMTHELVVLKTDLPDGALPVRKGAIPERQFRKIGEIEDLAPGKARRLTLRLAPGHYVLVCNRPGHYSMGMHTSLVVAP